MEINKKRSDVKKAQAALEFLVTYGWAFLVILIMIAALFYFGILSPSKFLPDRCNFGSEFSCKAYTIASNGINLRLSNNLAEPIEVNIINITTSDKQLSCDSNADNIIFNSGEIKDVSVACDFINTGLVKGEKGKLNLKLNYYPVKSGSSFSREVQGEIFSTVQQDSVVLADVVGIWHFDEGSGATAFDVSGNGNNGALVNAPVWVAGKKGNALSFDGTDDSVNITGPISLGDTWTVSVWFKTTSGGQDPLVSNRGIGGNVYFGISGGKAFLYQNGCSPPAINGNIPINDDQWHLYAFVRSSIDTTGKMYVDGILDKTGEQASCASQIGDSFAIAKDRDNNEYFPGSIDEVKVYNRALTANEILSEYNS